MGVPLLASLAGAVLIAACAPATPAQAPLPSLAHQIQDDMAARGAFAWSGQRRLRWADFAAPAPSGGDEGALTAYSIFYGVRCTGEAFNFLAVAGFLPHESWVKPEVTSDRAKSERMLRHEQTHFDLTEVYTRRLRKAFSGLYEPCRRSDADLDALTQQYLAAEKAEQRRYDEETHHGLVAGVQATWDHQVALDLTALSAYSR